MQFKIKELTIMFLTFLIASWIGVWVNDTMGFTGAGTLMGALATFMPFLLFYVIWKNYTKPTA